MGKRRIKKSKNSEPIAMAPSAWGADFLEAQRKEKGCTSKTIYYSQEQASESALFIRAEYGEKNLYPYKCQYEDHWHLGHRYD